MKIVFNLLREELIDLEDSSKSSSEFLEMISNRLGEKSYVKETFREAIVAREREFPTGLQLEGTAVAIPHTYVEHVIKPFISFSKILHPIPFIQMGTDDVTVNAEYVMVLGITDPKSQTGLLVELMELFSDPQFIDSLNHARTKQDVISLFTN